MMELAMMESIAIARRVVYLFHFSSCLPPTGTPHGHPPRVVCVLIKYVIATGVRCQHSRLMMPTTYNNMIAPLPPVHGVALFPPVQGGVFKNYFAPVAPGHVARFVPTTPLPHVQGLSEQQLVTEVSHYARHARFSRAVPFRIRCEISCEISCTA